MESYEAKIVDRVNSIEIVVIQNRKKQVAIRPICEAMGIDFSSQLQKLKEDEVLGSVVGLSPTTGKDGKVYEMATMPFEYVFGWIFSVRAKNVNKGSRKSLIKNQQACYNALYKYYNGNAEFLRWNK